MGFSGNTDRAKVILISGLIGQAARQKQCVKLFLWVLAEGINLVFFICSILVICFIMRVKLNPVVEESLHDNGLFHTSAGVDFSGRTCFSKLEANAGWVLGLERSRADNTGWITLNGLLIETRLEYKWFGLFNTFYKGNGLMHFYHDHRQ